MTTVSEMPAAGGLLSFAWPPSWSTHGCRPVRAVPLAIWPFFGAFAYTFSPIVILFLRFLWVTRASDHRQSEKKIFACCALDCVSNVSWIWNMYLKRVKRQVVCRCSGSWMKIGDRWLEFPCRCSIMEESFIL